MKAKNTITAILISLSFFSCQQSAKQHYSLNKIERNYIEQGSNREIEFQPRKLETEQHLGIHSSIRKDKANSSKNTIDNSFSVYTIQKERKSEHKFQQEKVVVEKTPNKEKEEEKTKDEKKQKKTTRNVIIFCGFIFIWIMLLLVTFSWGGLLPSSFASVTFI